MKIKNVKMIEVQEWDELVSKTYGRPYKFQQQDGCKDRGTFSLTVPSEYTDDDAMNDSIQEVVNGDEIGVTFAAWLVRDPKQKLPGADDQEDYCLDLFWSRSFYPDIYTVANDLHDKGLLEAGEYVINIDW